MTPALALELLGGIFFGGGGLNPQGVSRETPQRAVPSPGLGFSGFGV